MHICSIVNISISWLMIKSHIDFCKKNGLHGAIPSNSWMVLKNRASPIPKDRKIIVPMNGWLFGGTLW